MTSPRSDVLRVCSAGLVFLAVVSCGPPPTGETDPPITPGVFDARLAISSLPAAGLIMTAGGLSQSPEISTASGISGRVIDLGGGEYQILVTGVRPEQNFLVLRNADNRELPVVTVREAAGSKADGYRQFSAGQVQVVMIGR